MLRLTILLALLGLPGFTSSIAATQEKQSEPFWSFQPVQKLSPPSDKTVHPNPIDAFIAAKLAEQKLTFAGEADRLTLLRRATFDLTGLPPTPEEIRAFVADRSPEAYEKVIDRLLASPHYGERWGRHWLDVVRYTPGRVAFPGIKGTAGDSHFRDYVVRAFNADKPYDRFVTEQLAGDLLPPAADRSAYLDQIIAPAFLAIGAWFDQETDPNRLRLEMVDEMINTTTKAFLGLSVACARCHDHKTDPIPTADYYALGGIFRSTRIVGDFSEYWRDGRVRQLRPLAMPDEVAANDAIKQRIGELRKERWARLTSRHAEQMSSWQSMESRYRAAAGQIAKPFTYTFEAENFDGQDNLRIAQLQKDGQGADVLETQTPTAQWVKYKLDVPETATYRLESLYSTDDRNPLSVTVNGAEVANAALATPTGGFDLAYQTWGVVAIGELRAGTNFLRINAKEGNFPRLDRLRLVKVDPAVELRIQSVAAEQKLDAALLERFVYWPTDPWPTPAGIEPFLNADDQKSLAGLSEQADQLATTLKPYPLAVAVTDQPRPVDLPVHVRGMTYRTTPAVVPRGMPRLLDGALSRPAIPAGESGRLKLAQWLTDPRHPLTSRVMVNRIWGWHFGNGLVDSASDFGITGSKPSHPELLDWLAGRFIEEGWSIKRLHKLIMMSQAYRQSAIGSAEAQRHDPDNRLLSHFSRRRLESEALYDTMLSTTNNLGRQPSGSPLEFAKSSNRAMYTLTTGRSPKALGGEVRKMLVLFDSEMTGVPIGARSTSATPAQSLFWLNSPLVQFFADRFAERLLKMDKLTDPKRVEMAYLLALGHSPDKPTAADALAFVQQLEADGSSKQEAWSKLCQALYASAEFRYVE